MKAVSKAALLALWIFAGLLFVNGVWAFEAQAPLLVQRPSWKPVRSCDEMWKKEGLRSQYDFALDSLKTEQGNEGYLGFAAPLHRKDCVKPWTVLVYMAANNDLASYALMDLYEMEAGFKGGTIYTGSAARSDLVVQVDTPKSNDLRRFHMFQTPEIYDTQLSKGDFDKRDVSQVRSPVAKFIAKSEPRDHKRELLDFLKWGVREYPADHYMVIVWGHGQGWTAGPKSTRAVSSKILEPGDVDLGLPSIPQEVPSQTSSFLARKFGGLAFDDTDKSFLTIPNLHAVLTTLVQNDLEGNPIDVYASDACLMQMLEVSTELLNTARFIVGSTQVQNFLGLPYRRVMTEINVARFGGDAKTFATDDEAFLVARMIPRVFRASMLPDSYQGRLDPKGIQTITMSAINTGELKYSLLPALADFATSMNKYLDEDDGRLMDMEYLLGVVPGFQGGAQDVSAFMYLVSNMLSKESRVKGEMSDAARELQSNVAAVRDAVSRTVNSYALGTLYTEKESQYYLLGMRAVSVWLPSSREDYFDRIQDFRRSHFYRFASNPAGKGGVGPQWGAWIDKIYK